MVPVTERLRALATAIVPVSAIFRAMAQGEASMKCSS
jgi:hypothetical protein